jgi:eukaryotic-like serine/threonine-protein kinase
VPCPEPEVLSAFSRGRLDSGPQANVEAHLDGCEACGRIVADLVRIYVTDAPEDRSGDHPPEAGRDRERNLDETLADESLPAQPSSQLQPGTRLDRYHILEIVGRGGMGVVYAAYDPDLDRKVALKVLHERGGPVDANAQRRLLREAQAMAKLAHPNVITVHEARAVEGRVFISMEFVEGGTLGRWLATQAPELPQVLAMFRDVGRGLAAAHAAGLVHRDIKPDNVLIGRDERPRVTDFGLARPVDDDADLGASGGRSGGPLDTDGHPRSGEPRLLDATLTRAGTLVGTPAYMAPEQLRREPATAASDQFSFCVVLYEALWGTRPFSGRTLVELATRVVSGVMAEPVRDPGVPRWLRQVVLRGLALRPEDRWPSMDALVERLELHPQRTRRGLWVTGGLGVLVLAGLLASRGRSAPADPCDQGAHTITALWSARARADVRGALAQGSTAYAEDTATLAVQRLDAYTAQWAASHRDACESYHAGSQSAEALDLRGACLDERLRELRALVAVLGQADPEVRRHAIEAVDGLPALALCEDVPALRARAPVPDDPRVRAQVQEVEDERAQVHAELRAGRYETGLQRSDAVLAAARTSGHAPLVARVLRDRADLLVRLGRPEHAADDLREAWALALGAGDDPQAAECVVGLVSVLGYSLQRFDDAEVRIEEARAMIERVRRHDSHHAETLAGNLDLARGQIELRLHHHAAAVALHERALQVAERQAGPDGLRVAKSLNALAAAHMAQQHWDRSIALYRRVLSIHVEQLGAGHPETAHTRNNLGLALKNLGDNDEAIAQFEQALAVLRASLDPSHPSLPMTEINLAEAYYGKERYGEAADAYTRGYGAQGVGIEHEYALRRASHYGASLARSGRISQAREVLELAHVRAEALELPAEARGVDVELARVELEDGHPEQALARLERLGPPATEPDSLALEIALIRARALAAQGQRAAARAMLPLVTGGTRASHREDLERLLAVLDESTAPR